MLHPGILALAAGSFIVFFMVLYAGWLGVRIIRGWDPESSSERQLSLERETTLISSVVGYALGFVTVSLLLFIYTVDDIHQLFVGAMCATGSLNANPVGWFALGAKIVLFFAASVWVAMNSLDQRAPDYPLVRLKYAVLLGIIPLVAADLSLTLAYFLGLEPEVITSCCGSLFSESGGTGIAAEMAGLPVKTMIAVFFSINSFFVVLCIACLFWKNGIVRGVLSVVSTVSFFVSIAAVISFISLYIYELPTHHCPFDIFQKEYRFVGYPLYAGLFGGTYFGMLPGLFRRFRRIDSLRVILDRSERRWLVLAVSGMSLFLAITLWKMLSGTFTLEGYF